MNVELFPCSGGMAEGAGKTKRARWSQIGQAMPPALAEAVARAIRAAMEAADAAPEEEAL